MILIYKSIENGNKVIIPIDRQKKEPLYSQIELFIKDAIENGTLKVHTKLPSIRQLSKDINVNRMTVETAYQQLEAAGLIEKRLGSGTFVLPHHQIEQTTSDKVDSQWPLWQQAPQKRIRQRYTNLSAIPHNIDKSDNPINFAGGIGDPQLFPINEFSKILQKVIKRDGVIGLSYGEPNGYLPLRNTICQIMTSLGTSAKPENILITTGSQQAINLVMHLLLKPGDIVLTESPTYSGALDLFKASGIKQIGVPLDQDGMQLDIMEKMIQQHHPKLIYTIPTFHNPTGISMSGKRRRKLIAIAGKYNIPILEDDYVGDLRYDGCGQPTLKSLDTGGRVIYTSTFSKMLMPDLRIGFIIAEGPVYNCLVNLKCLTDLATSNLFQRALESYLSIGRYQSHLRKTKRLYRKRRDCMVNAINKYLGDCASFHIPTGGIYIWLQLHEEVDHKVLLENCTKEGVVYFTGLELHTENHQLKNFIRLNFAFQSEANIEKGIKRFSEVLNNLSSSQS